MTLKHDNAISHKISIAKYTARISVKKVGSVSTEINQQVKEKVIKNRALYFNKCYIMCFILCKTTHRTTIESKN